MNNIYQDPKNYSIEMISDFISNNQNDKVAEAVIGLSLYSDDRQNLQSFIFGLLNTSKNADVKNACIKALSHIVRIDKKIDNKILNIIDDLKSNPQYVANINDLLDDMEVYLTK